MAQIDIRVPKVTVFYQFGFKVGVVLIMQNQPPRAEYQDCVPVLDYIRKIMKMALNYCDS